MAKRIIKSVDDNEQGIFANSKLHILYFMQWPEHRSGQNYPITMVLGFAVLGLFYSKIRGSILLLTALRLITIS